MESLRKLSNQFWDEEKYAQAMDVWKLYDGKLADITAGPRADALNNLKERNKNRLRIQKEKLVKARETMDRLIERAAERLVQQGSLTDLIPAVEEATSVFKGLPIIDNRLNSLYEALKAVHHMDTYILEQYRGDVGQLVTIETVRGSMLVQLIDITDATLSVERQLEQGELGLILTANDLTMREKVLRLELAPESRHVHLLLGILNLWGRQLDEAVLHLERAKGDVAKALRAKLSTVAPEGGGNEEHSLKSSESGVLSPARLHHQLAQANPGYKANGAIRVSDGHIVSVNLQEASDLIQNLRPLKGLPLDYLSLAGVGLKDLNGLKGLPLKTLILFYMEIDSLVPLKGMQLNRLSIQGCRNISSLKNVEGMPLTGLDIRGSGVEELSPVRDAPLVSLMLSHNFQSFEAFQHYPLSHLDISETRITSLDGVQGMQLQSLFMIDTPIADVSALEDVPLERLRFNPGAIRRGMEILRNMPTLTRIADSISGDYLPAKVFWGRYDRGFYNP